MGVRNRQRGFTLVELMVVVAIVGILSAFGLPRILTYVRTSASAEVSKNAAHIASAISTYAQSQRKTAAAIAAEMNKRDVTPDLSGENELSTILPLVRLPPDSHFDYSIVAMVATGGPSARQVVFCITATGRDNAAVEGGLVLYSSAATNAQGWEGHINRTPFVNGNTNLAGVTPGGYCKGDRTVQAICEKCLVSG